MDYVFIAMFCTYFWGCSVYSAVAPFYPTIAVEKSMDEGLIGILFSMFAMVAFISSPLNGKLMQRFGRKNVLIAGGFIEIAGLTLFGLVYYMSGLPFIVFSFLGRILQGVGGSALFVSCLSIIANRYPTEIETKLGIVESSGSIGLIVGPLLGVAFYEIGGYVSVFIIYCIIFAALQVLLIYLVPPDHFEEEEKPRIQYREYLKIPEVTIALVAVVFGMAGLTFIEPVLATFLEKNLGFSQVMVGLFFCIPTLGYGSAVMIQGLALKGTSRKYFLAAGLLLEGTSFLIICQKGIFGMEDNLYLTAFALLVMGTGNALCYLPSLPYMVDAMVEKFPESNREELNDSLSTIMGTCHYLGETMGPLLAGYLVKIFDYDFGFAAFGTMVLMYFVVLFFGLKIYQFKRRDYTNLRLDETQMDFELYKPPSKGKEMDEIEK